MEYPFLLLNSIRNGKTANINSCRKAKVPFEKKLQNQLYSNFALSKIKN